MLVETNWTRLEQDDEQSLIFLDDVEFVQAVSRILIVRLQAEDLAVFGPRLVVVSRPGILLGHSEQDGNVLQRHSAGFVGIGRCNLGSILALDAIVRGSLV